jgi:hypothetical protein
MPAQNNDAHPCVRMSSQSELWVIDQAAWAKHIHFHDGRTIVNRRFIGFAAQGIAYSTC